MVFPGKPFFLGLFWRGWGENGSVWVVACARRSSNKVREGIFTFYLPFNSCYIYVPGLYYNTSTGRAIM